MNDAKPLVSVITIYLNPNEVFFKECIASVLAQTYTNWEFLLVNDGSSGGSLEIARTYAALHPSRVRCLEHHQGQNRGMSASRNLGVRNARGKYIAFLDSDDLWLPEKLEHQVAILNECPQVGMVYGPTLMWHSWTENPMDQHLDRYRHPGVELDTVVYPPTLLELILERKGESPGTCAVLLRRDAIERVDGFVESFQGMYEDQVFFSKIFLNFPVFVTSSCLDRYRQHPDSTCQVERRRGGYHPINRNSAEFAFLSWLESYCSQQSIDHQRLNYALKAALVRYRNPVLSRKLRAKKWFRNRRGSGRA
jgi:glycosyltransferase involved in cell wall biosynthesis